MSHLALLWVDSIQVGSSSLKAFLRFLATHNFPKPGFFFKNETYCYALEISEKTLQRILEQGASANLIKIERRFDDSGRQITNGIYLNIPDEFLNVYESKLMGRDVKLSEEISPDNMTTLGTSSCRPRGSQDDDPIIITNNNKSNSNIGDSQKIKSKKKKKKPEVSIPPTYHFNGDHLEIAKNLNIDINREFDIFKDHALQNDRKCRNWDAAFRNWLRKAKEFLKPNSMPSNRNSTNSSSNEIRSTVKEYGPGHSSWEEQREWERKHAEQGADNILQPRRSEKDGDLRGNGVRKVEDYLF